MPFNSTIFTGSNFSACNNRQTPFNIVRGRSSSASYNSRLISDAIEAVRFSFDINMQSDLTGYNFPQAYDPTPTKTTNTGFIDNYNSTDKYKIWQLNRDGQVTGFGYSLRWVPNTDISDLYVQKAGTNDFKSIYSTGTTFDQTAAQDSGVIFYKGSVADNYPSTSWGSSIESIYALQDVYEVQLTIDSATPVVASGGTLPSTGDIKQIIIQTTTGQILNGFMFRYEYDTGTGGTYATISVFRNNPSVLPDITTDSLFKSVELINGSPCFIYRISAVTRKNNTTNFKRIKFKDTIDKQYFSNTSIGTAQRDVRQWNWEFISNNQAEEIKGILYAWSSTENALYIEECDASKEFQIKYGPVYQPAVDAVVGNEGFSSKTNLTPTLGRFVNIKHTSTNQYSDTKNYIENETLEQTLSREVGYDSSANYIVGEKIIQIQQPNTNGDPDSSVDYGYSSATVLSWSTPDTTNPNAPMILVARIDKYGPDQPGAYGVTTKPFDLLNEFAVGDNINYSVSDYAFSGKILPYRVLKSEDRSWPYEVNGPNSYFTDNRETRTVKSPTVLNSTIGTTRVRAVTPFGSPSVDEIEPLYKFFLFDTELFENDNSFNNVVSLAYNDQNGNTKKIANIAPISGKKRFVETFPGTTQTINVYNTVVFEPSKDKNIFKLPTGSVFNNVIQGDSLSIEIQKIYSASFASASDSVTINATDGSSSVDGAVFLDADANINWFVINTDTGEKLNLTSSTATASTDIQYSVNQGVMTLKRSNTGTANSLPITVFAKLEKTVNINTVKTKKISSEIKILSGLIKQTTGKHKGKYTASIDVSGPISQLRSIYLVDDLSGTPIAGAEKVDSLFKIDVGINDQKMVKPVLVLNPGYIVVENNQDKLKGEFFNPKSRTTNILPSEIFLELNYDYYSYSSIDTPGIVLKESYKKTNDDPMDLKDIPFYLSPSDGKIYHESSIIDFRPNSMNQTDDFDMGNTKFIPHPDWSDSIEVSYYLPRRDKLVLNSQGKFEVLYGTPSLTPKYPQDKPDAMTLYLLDKADYVFTPSDVSFKRQENRRYTMRDIGKIDNRVKKLEYYTSLSLLEKSAEDLLVLDANGNNRFKSGILVDTFNGHKIGDVVHPDYNIAMDFNAGYARPPFKTQSISLVKTADDASTTFVRVQDNSFYNETERNRMRDNIYMFPFTKEVFVAQPLATRSITVQPHEVTVFEGQGNIWPPISNWVDTESRPAVRVNLAGENDAWSQMVAAFNNNNLAPFGTQWNEWETLSRIGISSSSTEEEIRTIIAEGNRNRGELPTGTPDLEFGARWRWLWRDTAITTLTTTTVTEQLQQERNGFFNELTTSTSDVSLGNRIVDVSIQPYMREGNLKFWAFGLKPLSKMYVYFDGINVEEYCYKYNSLSDLFNDVEGTTPTSYPFATSSISDLKTNEEGQAFIEFRLPSGIFRTGDRKFEVSDEPRNDRNKATSYASATYSASGLRTVSEETIATTRSFDITSTPLPTEQRTIEETTVSVSENTVIVRNNWDPLAQTFFVDPALYPEGIFLQSVELFFARKPSANIPVHIQLRPVVNGFPDSKKIYPGGVVYKQRDEVNVSDIPNASDSSTKTVFAFTRPIHLAPGEHAIVVKSPSSEYEVYIATLGEFLLETEQRVTNQPYVGVFFTSANASTWSPEQNTDMMMILNKCVFETGTNYQMDIKNDVSDNQIKYHTANLSGSYIDFNSSRIQWELLSNPLDGSTLPAIRLEPNANIELPITCSYGGNDNNTVRVTMQATSTNRDVSPVIDLDAMSLFTVENLIENNSIESNGELNPFASVPSANVARVRYISRVVTLEDGFESNNLKCVLTINKPQGTNIQVFAKTQDSFSTSEFHQNPYVKMNANVQNFDTYYTNNPNDYVEVEFDLPQDTVSPYNKFCIKICLYSENAAFVPKVKDMRAMAVL